MESTTIANLTAPKEPRLGGVCWLGIVAAFFVLYGLTAQRGVNWQDSAIFQYRILDGDYEGFMGLAVAHPLYIALGRVVLFLGGRENLPILTNLLSALAMALAMGNLAALTTRLVGRRWIGVLIAGMAGLTHTVWWLATITETYPWSLLGVTCELLLLTALLRRPGVGVLAGLMFVSGLGVCMHNFALLPLPVYGIVTLALVFRRKLPAWSLAVAAGAYIFGAGLYLSMIVMLAVREGSLALAISSALVGDFGKDVANVAGVSSRWKENAILSAMNFVNPILPLAVVGWIRFRRRLGGALAVALGGITVIEMVFFVRYPVPDQFMFILPSLVMIAVAAAVGLAVLADAGKGLRWAAVSLCLLSIIVQPTFYAVAPQLARRFQGPSPKRHPFRNEWRYWLTPWKQNETSAEQFCRFLCKNAPTEAVVILDSTACPPLQVYQRAKKQREDITVMMPNPFLAWKENDPATYRDWLESRPMYVRPAPKEAAAIKLFGPATITPCFDGILFHVTPANPQTQPGEK